MRNGQIQLHWIQCCCQDLLYWYLQVKLQYVYSSLTSCTVVCTGKGNEGNKVFYGIAMYDWSYNVELKFPNFITTDVTHTSSREALCFTITDIK
jgi:hypothetical protein